jgi:hypothetical protein
MTDELFVKEVDCPKLATTECRQLVPLARQASRTNGSPVVLSDDELIGILEAAL